MRRAALVMLSGCPRPEVFGRISESNLKVTSMRTTALVMLSGCPRPEILAVSGEQSDSHLHADSRPRCTVRLSMAWDFDPDFGERFEIYLRIRGRSCYAVRLSIALVFRQHFGKQFGGKPCWADGSA